MRVLVCAWLGSGNLGDELIFRALLELLRDRGADVAAVSLDPDATRATHRIAAVSHRQLGAVAGLLSRSDAVVFGGGGLLQDDSSLLSVPYHGARPWLAGRRGTPVAALGLGAGPLHAPVSRQITRAALARAVGVAARDRASARLLREVGVSGVREAADLALGLAATPPAEPVDVLSVCLRPQLPRGRYLPGRLRSRQPDADGYAATMAAALDEAARALGLGVELVSLEPRRDAPFNRLVADRMRSSVTLRSPDLDDLVATVGRGRVVVSTRYHGAVCAALAGRPVAMLGYAPKVRELATQLTPAAVLLENTPTALTGLPARLSELAGRAPAMTATLGALQSRVSVNAEVLDDLLEVAARPGRPGR